MKEKDGEIFSIANRIKRAFHSLLNARRGSLHFQKKKEKKRKQHKQAEHRKNARTPRSGACISLFSELCVA